MSCPRASLQRFNAATGEIGSQQNLTSETNDCLPTTARRLKSLGSTDTTLMKEMKKQKILEREIRALVRERGEQDKRLQALEEDFMKSEAKLTAAVREKTSLLANVASLEKQLLELTRTNEFLKSKFSEDGAQKKMSSLCMEIMKLRNKMEAKNKHVLAKQEDMEMKLQAVQKNLVHSKGKVAQLEEKLTATERNKVEEKSDTEKLLEYITELSGVAEQVQKYKLDVLQMEKLLVQKDQDIMALNDCFTRKEEKLSKFIRELNERCQLFEHEKETLLTENREREQSMNAEIETLKKRLLLEEQEHQKLQQKQKEMCYQLQQEKELSTSVHQKLLEFQEEMTNERHVLEEELEAALKELDKLHIKEEKVDELIKHLEQENKSRVEELAEMEAKLKRKNTELKRTSETHSKAIAQMQEEHSNTLRKLGESIAEFESYKGSMTEEMACLQLDNSSLQEKVAELREAGQDMQQQLYDLEHAKDKAKEEYARMLLDAQTKLALKEAEIRRTKESCISQMTELQTQLEEQTEDFTKQLEIERSRKTIEEKVVASFKEEIQTWRSLYEDLHNKTKPFQQQLDAFEAEKNALMNEHGAAQEELNKLSDAYAKLLGHQNQRQKIKHVMKLKDENAQLKQEVLKLRAQVAKERQAQRDLQEQLYEIKGIRRLDPSKAFQHDSKENVAPKTPLKEGNRNRC
ncbi:hyaluronan mediated motility receptor isoform X2 [Pelodiscus sinensis]|uniref:Hyaluronan mediated motility receptor n=1 Tax=Pelodiscus sinensis TaxID=13735 RepID=K7FDX2_PELSI|nr:hyaluronan mediated motility receptor isoform X2 [Pelodiscus sinensis]|eukprot:XP_006133663.1 hyaluronan mediated motility receptor isoform X2 [Pelodiscus sinensis]